MRSGTWWVVLGVALAAAGIAVRADEATDLYRQAQAAHQQADYSKALDLLQRSLAAGARQPAVAYDAACAAARLGRTDEAFEFLQTAIERGWRQVDHMQGDPDLESLRSDARWTATAAAARQARDQYLAGLKAPDLARELLERMAADQRVRTAEPIDIPAALRVDAENTAWMKQVIAEHGWPGKSLVGVEAANAAWLLVQHADADRAFQQQCLPLLRKAFEAGEATGQQLAYLTDRVRVGAGQPQVYGTQFRGGASGAEPAPIENEAEVDQRRAEVGLPPLAEYAALMKSMPAPTGKPTSAPATGPAGHPSSAPAGTPRP